jgi:thymidylate synthase
VNSSQPTVFRNVTFATVAGLRDLLDLGTVLRVRDKEVREIRNRTSVLERPCERCLLLRHRANNIFASLAETFWVLAGRNDVAWLQHYLPRVLDFSDDGITWRAAYGPRLRNWNGVDQLKAVRELFIDERLTRRAVMSLYDPGHDFVASKDIPCHNWLHWLLRDGRLHLNLGIRSNDVIWGFSGINAFEWSILHEMMAYWIGALPGEATFFASSFHLYDRHYERARQIVSSFDGICLYDFDIESPPFHTPWDDFDEALRQWFAMEAQIRESAEGPGLAPSALGDPLLDGALGLLKLYNGSLQGWDIARIRQELAELPETDLTAAAYEFFGRRSPELLEQIPQAQIDAFFRAFRRSQSMPASASQALILKLAIKALHQRKNAAYADAWKHRGELISILPNIARKVDRLAAFVATRTALPDESVLDTAVDLFVYVTKYRLFLLEVTQENAVAVLPLSAPRPLSDHVENFDLLVDQAPFGGGDAVPLAARIGEIVTIFEDLQTAATATESQVSSRLERANRLWAVSGLLLGTIGVQHPQLVRRLMEEQERGV